MKHTIILFLGGITLGLMTSLNGQLASYINVFQISFITHIIGLVILLLINITSAHKKLKKFAELKRIRSNTQSE